MFDAISDTIRQMKGTSPPSSEITFPIRGGAGRNDVQNKDTYGTFENRESVESRSDEKSRKDEQQKAITQRMLKDLEHDIETIHNIGLQFSMHDETGKTVIKIMDKTENKLIREIPSEEVLQLAAKLDEMIGILFDRKV